MKRITAACVAATTLATVVAVSPAHAIGGFGDVLGDEYYANAVQWMVDEQITTGTSEGCFSPDQPLTRGQLATFIWRYAESPSSSASTPFVDVPGDAFYTEAVSWMYAEALTTGTSPTTFEPNRVMSRGELATFLWRYAGSPGAASSGFMDVGHTDYFAGAVDWMVSEKITTGTSATTFSPRSALSRAMFAAFLWRYDGEPYAADSGGGTCGETGQSAGALFFEDFAASDSLDRFDTHIFHRDDSLQAMDTWLGDHGSTGGDNCSSPFESRVIERGERSEGFNDQWRYRCVPGGDTAKAHLMTSIGDTSGYSIGAFAPAEAFTGVREVRWDVNQTDLGDRQFTEVAIIPVSTFDMDKLPCNPGLPCDTATHDELGSVGTQWGGLRARMIHTWDEPTGYTQANGGLGYRCEDCPYAPGMRFGATYGQGDPALSSVVIRRQNYFRDNGNGTLTWGFQLEDGSFQDFTVPGSFPEGPVRVVFKDHGYTPLKATPECQHFPELACQSDGTITTEAHRSTGLWTWHWDNITVFGDMADSGSGFSSAGNPAPRASTEPQPFNNKQVLKAQMESEYCVLPEESSSLA